MHPIIEAPPFDRLNCHSARPAQLFGAREVPTQPEEPPPCTQHVRLSVRAPRSKRINRFPAVASRRVPFCSCCSCCLELEANSWDGLVESFRICIFHFWSYRPAGRTCSETVSRGGRHAIAELIFVSGYSRVASESRIEISLEIGLSLLSREDRVESR